MRSCVYLPREEFVAFGLTENDISTGVETGTYDDRWREIMKFPIARARQIYEEAWPGIAMLNPRCRFSIAAASTFYWSIIDDIVAHDYEVFTRRAHVGLWGKIRKLSSIWRQSRFAKRS